MDDGRRFRVDGTIPVRGGPPDSAVAVVVVGCVDLVTERVGPTDADARQLQELHFYSLDFPLGVSFPLFEEIGKTDVAARYEVKDTCRRYMEWFRFGRGRGESRFGGDDDTAMNLQIGLLTTLAVCSGCVFSELNLSWAPPALQPPLVRDLQ